MESKALRPRRCQNEKKIDRSWDWRQFLEYNVGGHHKKFKNRAMRECGENCIFLFFTQPYQLSNWDKRSYGPDVALKGPQ